MAKTLLDMAGADLTPARVADAALVLIDLQNEYRAGPIAVTGADAAIANAARLLRAARDARAPIVHVAHKGRAGGLFDREAARGQIVAPLMPQADETVVEKGMPNAFAGTDLKTLLDASGRKNLILCGFMTHMCVSSTARAATDLGFRVTIDASSCGTRDLPDGKGGTVAAAILHDVSLAELADRFAIVARATDEII
ncbi:MAG TPA: isochorismatase family protein [Stellaceae bacterium]|nr:isochorismatase family protein [Stellaceae bacterium]